MRLFLKNIQEAPYLSLPFSWIKFPITEEDFYIIELKNL